MINGIAIGLSALAGVWLGWYAIPICLSVLIAIQLLERRRQVVMILLCIVAVVIGSFRSQEAPTLTMTEELAVSTGAVGTVSTFPIPSGDGHRAVFSVAAICVADQCIEAETQVLLYFGNLDPPPSRGQTLHISWRLDTLQDLPTGYRGFVSSQGAEASARATSVQILAPGNPIFRLLASANQRVASTMEELLPGDTGALGTGIVTGDDSGLSAETEANFRATGTTHITAVSGQNVTLIIGFLSFWFRPKTPHFRLLFHFALFTAVWSFTLFVGMESPALRAAIVATLSIAGSHVGRRPDPVTLLSLTLGIIALFQPLSVHAVGFWLSASASMALCLALPKTRPGSTKRFIMDLAGAPMFASIATMPISLVSFGVWSPIGILTNMLISPVMTAAFPITYLFALFAAVVPGIAESFSWIPAIPLEIALVIVNRMAPVAMQWRIESFSPALLILTWLPIAVGIWLVSNESQRWIRRALFYRQPSTQ